MSSSIVPVTMPVNDAADYLGISRATIYVLLREGALTKVKLGHRTLIRRADLDRLVGVSATPHEAGIFA